MVGTPVRREQRETRRRPEGAHQVLQDFNHRLVLQATVKALTSKESKESSGIAVPLADRVGIDADAKQVAAAVLATWQEVEDALTPIVGQRGVAALYKRSLHLSAGLHPWLSKAHESGPTVMDLTALKSVISQQSSAAAAAGGSHLLQTFHDLLASLIGPSLTERLLRSVWARSAIGLPEQDTAQ